MRSRYNRGIRVWGWSVGILLLLAACAYGQQVWTGKAAGPVRLHVIVKATDPSVEFWQVLSDGVREASAELGADVRILGPVSEQDVEGQIALLEQSVGERPDAIILAADDEAALRAAADRAVEAGIPLLTVDSGIGDGETVSFIATDNVRAGEAAGQLLPQVLEDPAAGAKVAIVSYPRGSSSQRERELGVRSVLEGRSDMELVGTYYCDGSQQGARDAVRRLLAEHPDLAGIIGLNEPTTVGAGQALREHHAGQQQPPVQVRLIGFDSSIGEVQLLEEGILQATIIQRPFQMGYLSVKTAVESLRGERVKERIDTGHVVITKSNMYEEENQKLLFPFVER